MKRSCPDMQDEIIDYMLGALDGPQAQAVKEHLNRCDGCRQPTAQRTLLDALDQVPSHRQMLGHVPDGHVVRQLQNVPFERMGVGASLLGKTHRHLANLTTVGTSDTRHIQLDLDRSGADGKTAKATGLKSPPYDTPRPASRTAKISGFLTDREGHPARLIRGLDIPVAPNPKPVVQ